MKLTPSQQMAIRAILGWMASITRKSSFDMVKDAIIEKIPDGDAWVNEYEHIFVDKEAGDMLNQNVNTIMANIECERVPEPMVVIGRLRGLFRKKRREEMGNLRRLRRVTCNKETEAYVQGYNNAMDDAMGITKPFLPPVTKEKPQDDFTNIMIYGSSDTTSYDINTTISTITYSPKTETKTKDAP